ncbi:MAG: hypothetical protein LBR22_00215 [Desulfovibrio sp.]|nr:hypothetical protein [Desulfovibrio sp.]
MHKTISIFGILLIACMLSVSCTSKYGAKKMVANYYPQCYQPISQLRADENTGTTSAVIGAAAGAVVGAAVGAVSTRSVQGAVAGAAAGAAAGGLGGLVVGKAQKKAQDDAMLRQYAMKLDEDTSQMTRETAAAKVSLKCYTEQFNELKAQYTSGAMNKIDYIKHFDEIRAGLTELSTMLDESTLAIAEKETQYRQAFTASYTTVAAMSPRKKKAAMKKAQKKFIAQQQTAAPALTQQPSPAPATPAPINNAEITDKILVMESTKEDMGGVKVALQDMMAKYNAEYEQEVGPAPI